MIGSYTYISTNLLDILPNKLVFILFTGLFSKYINQAYIINKPFSK